MTTIKAVFVASVFFVALGAPLWFAFPYVVFGAFAIWVDHLKLDDL
jgi:hypothetical protein